MLAALVLAVLAVVSVVTYVDIDDTTCGSVVSPSEVVRADCDAALADRRAAVAFIIPIEVLLLVIIYRLVRRQSSRREADGDE
jgi:hypothetical protein